MQVISHSVYIYIYVYLRNSFWEVTRHYDYYIVFIDVQVINWAKHPSCNTLHATCTCNHVGAMFLLG